MPSNTFDFIKNLFTTEEGLVIFKRGDFVITNNGNTKVSINSSPFRFTEYFTLNNIRINEFEDERIVNRDLIKPSFNYNPAELSYHGYYGSVLEKYKTALLNILQNFPFEIIFDARNKIKGVPNIFAIKRDTTNNTTVVVISTEHLNDSYGVRYYKTEPKVPVANYKDLVRFYSHYTFKYFDEHYKIIDIVPADSMSGDFFAITIEGTPLLEGGQYDFKLVPSIEIKQNYFKNISGLEKHILNINSDPLYTFEVLYNEYDSDTRITKKVSKTFTLPSTDGYNPDFITASYSSFVQNLKRTLDEYEQDFSNIITRKLVAECLIEFDTNRVEAEDDSTSDSGSRKIDKILKIYGRIFDDIRISIEGIKNINRVTYDNLDNPNTFILRNMLDLFGWSDSLLFKLDINSEFGEFIPFDFNGNIISYSKEEIENQFIRKLILNSPYIFRSKGTRALLEFMIDFLGIPRNLININEVIYIARNTIGLKGLDLDTLIIEKNVLSPEDVASQKDSNFTYIDSGTFREIFSQSQPPMVSNFYSELPFDEKGYPNPVKDNQRYAFQVNGGWYKENNLHKGTHDLGNKYLEQFTDKSELEISRFIETKRIIPNRVKCESLIKNRFQDRTAVNKFCSLSLDSKAIIQNALVNSPLEEYAQCGELNDACTFTLRWFAFVYIEGRVINPLDDEFYTSGNLEDEPNQTLFNQTIEDILNDRGFEFQRIGNKIRIIDNDYYDCETPTLGIEITVELDYNCDGC